MPATLGEKIRSIRHRKALTQEALAEKARLKKLTLRQIETGKTTPRLPTIQKIARALEVTPEELTSWPLSAHGQFARNDDVQFPACHSFEQEAFPHASELETHVPHIRRALLDFNAMPCGQREAKQTLLSLSEIRSMVNEAYRLRQASQYSKLGIVVPGLLRAAQLAVREYRDEQQRVAFCLLAEANHVAAAFLKKAGRHELAWVAVDRGALAAERAETVLIQTASAYRLANLLLETGQLDEAVNIASQSIDTLEAAVGAASPSYISLWGALLLKRSVIAARQKDAATAWVCIGEAKAAAKRLGTDRNDFWTAFGPTNVAIHEVSVAAELGEWGRASRRAQAVNLAALPPALIERRASFLIEVSRCFASERRDEKALHSLLEAERIAPEDVHHNRHAQTILTDLIARERKGALPELRALAARSAIRI